MAFRKTFMNERFGERPGTSKSRTFLLCLGCALFISQVPVHGRVCSTARTLELNSVLDFYHDTDLGDDVFRLEIPHTGILILGVADLAPSRFEPRLQLLSEDCAGVTARDASLMELSRDQIVLNVHTPGAYFVSVSVGEAPRSGYGRIEAGFAEYRSIPPVDSDLLSKADEIIEWDEDDMSQNVHSDPYFDLLPVCRLLEPDDHGDSRRCASAVELGSAVEAEIFKASATDLDYFFFTLDRHATVVLETLGEVDTAGRLLDRYGALLAVDDSGSDGVNFRIERALCPGSYFLRVEGTGGSEGAYVLRAALLQ